MIRYLIDHLRLKNRIFLSGALAGGVAIAIIATAALTFNRTAGDFVEFVDFSRRSQVDLLTTAKIYEIQRQALIYTHEGYKSAADQVEAIHGLLGKQIGQALAQNDAEVTPIASTINERLQNYFEAFQQVKLQRERWDQLVNVDFRKHASETEQLLSELIEQVAGTGVEEAELLRLLNLLLLVEKHAFRYFDTLDASHIAIARASLREARQGLDRIKTSDTNLQKVRETLRRLDSYEKSFVEAVQRTRGYLYLVNVVMPADAYEIIYQSRRLSRLLTGRMQERQTSILSSISAANVTLLLTGGLLLLLLSLLSYAIGRSITRPISQLAETFRKLTLKQRDAAIPVYRIDDEIGELTLAAEAFNDKNRETENLLRHSQELTHALEQSKRELERSNDELEQFVYTVSHDLKSPLVTSMVFIGIIRNLADQGRHDEAIAKLDKVVKSNERMSQLINDLLELSRVGRIDLDKNPVDLNEMLGRFARNQQERLASQGFTLVIADGLPTVIANESRLLQLFENIVSNALKYVQNEAGARLEIGAVEDDKEGRWLVYCKDNGPGIAPEYHQKIFGLFYRLETALEGTGIGLAIAKKVMKFHGGDIWVESNLGEGATFWLSFPKATEG